MENRIEVGSLLDSMRELLSITLKPVLTYVIAMTVICTALDFYDGKGGQFFVVSISSTIAGYLLARALVLKTGLAQQGEVASFGSYFGLGWLEGLAYLFGAILLIFPAVVLMIRWTPSIPLLMCERRGIQQSMDLSWNSTKGSFWPLFGLTLLGAIPYFLSLAVAFVLFARAGAVSIATGLALYLVTNLALMVMGAYYSLLSLATYKQLFRPHEGLVEVFA